mgnify:CR=1 FL=1
MPAEIRHMKWWGWGYEDVTFDDSNKPELWPYFERELKIGEIEWTRPVAFEDIDLPKQKWNEPFFGAIRRTIDEDQIAVIAPAVHPSGQRHAVAGVALVGLTAGHRLQQVTAPLLVVVCSIRSWKPGP